MLGCATWRLCRGLGVVRARARRTKRQRENREREHAAFRHVPFVGRTDEFGHLIGLIAGLTSGGGHVALLEGEAGIGKSRLVREVIRHVHSLGLATLAANCYEIEKGVPYHR
ncbi:MAG: ATP-binding protein [Casimicrobiaceae bacterium]